MKGSARPLVKMWPGGTPHVVVGTLKISLDRLKVAGNPVFSRSTNLESKLIDFFVLLNC